MRVNIWGFALATALVQSADWLHLGHTADYELYLDPASVKHQSNGRVTFRVKREYSHDADSGEPFGSGGVEFMAIGDLIANCAQRTVSVMDVTIQDPSGKVLEREQTTRPMPVPVAPGSVGEAELTAVCGQGGTSH